MSDKARELFLSPQAGCFKCKNINWHDNWQECADYSREIIEKLEQRVKEQDLVLLKIQNSIALASWNIDEKFHKWAKDMSVILQDARAESTDGDFCEIMCALVAEARDKLKASEAKVKELEAQKEDLRILETINITLLKDKLDKALEALEFYADSGSWDCDSIAYHAEIIDDLDMEPNPDGIGCLGGKLARQVLKEIKEMK